MRRMSLSLPIFIVPILFLPFLSCDKLFKPEPKKPARVLRLGHDGDVDTAIHIAALDLATRVEQKTSGRLKIEIHPKQALGTDHAMIEMARAGELDLVIPPTSKMSHIDPAMQVLDLPFFYSDRASIDKVLDGRVGKHLLESVKSKGLYGLAIWQGGWKHFTTNFPVNAPADFAGKKIRVMRSPMIMSQFEHLGAKPVAIDFAETYNALKDKQVEGQENPLNSIHGMKFYEVQSHLTLSRHAYLAQMLIASGATMDSLSPEDRAILVTEAEAATSAQRKTADDDDAKFLEKIKTSGIQISELSSQQRDVFRESMAGLVYQFMDVIGAELIQQVVEDLQISLPKDDAVVVAINADLSGKSAVAGQAITRGVSLAVSEINRSGGIGGKKVRVLTLDHQAVAARSSDNIEKISNLDNVKIVFGGLQSAIILGDMPKISELAKKDKVFISSWATAEALTRGQINPNPIFRVSARDSLVAPYLVREAIKRGKKVALLFENSAWGRGNQEAMGKVLKASGVRPKREEVFNVDQKDFVAQIKAIEDSGAEVLLMAANPAEAKEIIKTMIGRPKKIPVIAHWGFTGGTFGRDLAEDLKNVDLSFLQTVAFLDNKRPMASKVATEYLSEFGGKEVADIDAAAGVARSYDAMRLAALALQAQAKNPKLTLIKAMEDVTGFEGIVTSYKYPFKGRREALETSVYRLGRYDDMGRIVPAERTR